MAIELVRTRRIFGLQIIIIQLISHYLGILLINVSNKKLVHFSEEEGSGGHCEMLARSLYNQRIFDWLDETLAL